MRNQKLALILGACALALAACGDRQNDEKEAAAPAAGAAAAPTGAGPVLKAGLWEETTTIEDQGSNTIKKCIGSEGADLMAQVRTESSGACNPIATPVAGGWEIAVTCNMGAGGTMQSKGTMKGDLNSAYTSEAVSTVEGAEVPHMNRSMKVSVQAKHLGACPEDMNPGAIDTGQMIIDPSGMKK